MTIKDRTAVVGIGQTAFGKGLEDSELSLACQAISAAIDDAGMTPSEVDGLAMYSMENGREVDVARNVGLGDITYFGEVGYGGGAGCGTVGQAAMAVATGQCQVAVAWRARKRAAKTSRPWAQVGQRLGGAPQWTRPFGLLRPVDEIAMLTRRYMHEYGATRDHLANVALAFRKHANRNPNATMYTKPLTRERTWRRAGSPSRCACSTTASRPTARWRWWSSPPSGPATCRSRRPTCTPSRRASRSSTR